MLLLYFLWIDLMLVLITSGFITTAIVLYVISGTLLFIRSIAGVTTIKLLMQGKIDIDLFEFKDNEPKITRNNIICSNIIHLVLIVFFLSSSFAFVAVILGAIGRIVESISMEKYFKWLN